MLRQSEMCVGPHDCPAAETAQCNSCRAEWQCEDTNTPGACRTCNHQQSTIRRCSDCPLTRLNEIHANSFAGILINRVLGDFEFAVDKFGLTLDDVTAEEFKAFQIVNDERHKHRMEQQDDANNEWKPKKKPVQS